MNKFEKWVSSQKAWVHILLALLTYGIWLIVWIVVEVRVYNNTPAQVRFEKEFFLEDFDKYQENINELIDIEKENHALFKGMSTDEIKKYGKKVYEADGLQLTWPSFGEEWSKETHLKICTVRAQNKKEDKSVVVGTMPDSVYNEIYSYSNCSGKRKIHAVIKNGNYKLVDKDGKVKLHKQPAKVKVTFKLYDK